MAGKYTDEQEAIRKQVREFAEKEVAPEADARDRESRYDYALYRRAGELGIIGLHLPERWGGTNAGFLAWNLALEELARVDPSYAESIELAASCAELIIEMGTEEQKERWGEMYVRPTVRGEATGSLGITEPGAGSDTHGIKTMAVLDGDEWVINGNKAFIGAAGFPHCLFVHVVCLTDKDKRGFSTILVPKGTPGYTIMPKYNKMGWRSFYTFELYFDDCRVPAMNLVGMRGAGRHGAARVRLPLGRICAASVCTGIQRASLEKAVDYAKQRIAFGRPIAAFQHVQAMLVEMALNLELSTLLRDHTARMIEEAEAGKGPIPTKESSMTKWFCTENAEKSARNAMQIFGGAGYIEDLPLSRFYRDARPFTIVDGTTEIHKVIIARELGLIQKVASAF